MVVNRGLSGVVSGINLKIKDVWWLCKSQRKQVCIIKINQAQDIEDVVGTNKK